MGQGAAHVKATGVHITMHVCVVLWQACVCVCVALWSELAGVTMLRGLVRWRNWMLGWHLPYGTIQGGCGRGWTVWGRHVPLWMTHTHGDAGVVDTVGSNGVESGARWHTLAAGWNENELAHGRRKKWWQRYVGRRKRITLMLASA